MAEFYNTLGKDIVIDAIIKAKDANDVVTALTRELTRRGLTGTVQSVTAETEIEGSVRDKIRADLGQMDYVGADNPAQTRAEAQEMQKYIAYIKALYEKKLKE